MTPLRHLGALTASTSRASIEQGAAEFGEVGVSVGLVHSTVPSVDHERPLYLESCARRERSSGAERPGNTSRNRPERSRCSGIRYGGYSARSDDQSRGAVLCPVLRRAMETPGKLGRCSKCRGTGNLAKESLRTD